MATRVITTTHDDLDGTVIEDKNPRHSFTLDGRQYEIDLSEANYAKLHKALQPFMSAGTLVSRPGPNRRAHRDPAQLAKIREWAAENGHPVSARGRIPRETEAAYEAAMAPAANGAVVTKQTAKRRETVKKTTRKRASRAKAQ